MFIWDYVYIPLKTIALPSYVYQDHPHVPLKGICVGTACGMCKGPSVHKARESSDIRCKERRYAVGGYGYTSPENVLVDIAKTEGTLKVRC